MNTRSYNNFSGIAAILAGIGVELYSIAFVILASLRVAPNIGLPLSAILLLVDGLLTVIVFTALYLHVREMDSGFALLAILFGAAGALASSAHGAFDLANVLYPPNPNVLETSNYPSAIDPRGFATFGLTGLGLVVFGWLMLRGKMFPTRLAQLALLLGIISIVIYLARLIILSPANPIVFIVIVVTGFIISPVFYVWLGITLRRMGTG
ncbi:MAG TPA: hypothetical protein VFD70_25345 [Anaerolineae bacterium]|nr:hypothetical protein [Anaerolineae bacterium]